MERRYFPQFYQKNVQRIYKYLYFRVGGNKEVAQDLAQDVFVKALEAFERYDETISASAWIFTIARNHLLNHFAKQRPGTTLDELENTIWDHEDWASRAEIRHDEKRLLEAIKHLSHEDAELIRGKHLEGWTYDELSERTGKTPEALRVRSHRALKELRKILKQL